MAFIVIEGGEGAGKTTQLKLLKEKLPALYPNRDFVFTKEPGSTPFADKIKELILSDGAKEASGRTMLALFIASRFDHVEHVIRPALAAKKIVICDRFIAATYAYQVVAHECRELVPLYTEHVKLLENWLPTLNIMFDINPKVALERLKSRQGQAVSHYDARELSFHERLRAGYKEYAERFAPQTTTFINADQPIEKIHEDLVAVIKDALG